MNILYDISILGMGYAQRTYQTGIYRVVESLTPHIAATPDCHLTFCAPSFSGMTARYLRTRPDLSHIPCPDTGWKRRVNGAFYDTHFALESGQHAVQLPYRALRRLLYHADNLIQNSASPYIGPLDKTSLMTADIYHSLHYSLPPQTHGTRRIQRFLTVYDLIPVLFPQYFTPSHAQAFERILASLHPDDWVLAISQATKDDLCAHHPIAPERVFVTPLAADPALFYPAEVTEQQRVRCKYNLPPGPYLLSLNTLEPRKNLDRLIRCFARLVQQEHLSDLNLVLTGSKGWNSEQIFAELSGLEAMRDRILLAGRVEDEDLAGLYSGATAFVYPSLYEGFGLPPLEAMQCGTPVITSNTSSLPEVVGEAGLMITPTDEDGLCQSMLHLLTDTDLHAEKAEKALERASEFSWERCAQLTVEAYKTALKQTPAQN